MATVTNPKKRKVSQEKRDAAKVVEPDYYQCHVFEDASIADEEMAHKIDYINDTIYPEQGAARLNELQRVLKLLLSKVGDALDNIGGVVRIDTLPEKNDS